MPNHRRPFTAAILLSLAAAWLAFLLARADGWL